MKKAGISDERSHTAAKNILLVMGEFFQIQVSRCIVLKGPCHISSLG